MPIRRKRDYLEVSKQFMSLMADIRFGTLIRLSTPEGTLNFKYGDVTYSVRQYYYTLHSSKFAPGNNGYELVGGFFESELLDIESLPDKVIISGESFTMEIIY